MKKSLKKIKDFLYHTFTNIKNLHFIIKFAKYFLSNGIYFISKTEKKIMRLNKKLLIRDGVVFFVVAYKRKNKYEFNKHITYRFGGNKIVICTKDRAYGCYKTKKSYFYAKKNIIDYYDKINYPLALWLFYNDKAQIIGMKKIIGKTFEDRYHDLIIIDNLFHYAIDLVPVFCKDRVLFIQHGDCKRGNIIWEDDSSHFIFIDLDGLCPLPLLFDLFHYFGCINMSLQEIVEQFDKHKVQLAEIAKKVGMEYNNNFIDHLFYNYILCYKKWGNNFNDFKFLTTENSKDYKKTNDLLKNILADR